MIPLEEERRRRGWAKDTNKTGEEGRCRKLLPDFRQPEAWCGVSEKPSEGLTPLELCVAEYISRKDTASLFRLLAIGNVANAATPRSTYNCINSKRHLNNVHIGERYRMTNKGLL
jgi:hypothetical protein